MAGASGRDGLQHALGLAFCDRHGRARQVALGAEAGEALVFFAQPPWASGLDGRPWQIREPTLHPQAARHSASVASTT
ncbi:hypothetical protein [Nannocystis punicea]|uniref:Uncharacterized protein n=1 Tax=Nannocystis punicea TaxID=2995304 RepID=A0ABY7HCE1_9BACT|nr:hypothetical protein [Nannocystis poenicansa]WAS96929.1 hypothetical protein O0S08_12335 [Nannocystis poenicansa]